MKSTLGSKVSNGIIHLKCIAFLEHAGVYEYKSTVSLKGNVWKMGDFIIRLGVLNIGITSKHLLFQVEYGALATQKAAVFIEDFMKQLLTEDGYGEVTQVKGRLNGLKIDETQDHVMQTHQRVRQYAIPIIEEEN